MSKKTGMLEKMKSELLFGLRTYYFNIATNVFKWKSLPDEIPVRYPEKWLYENGMSVFLEIPNAGYACLPVMTESIEKNLYGEPSSWKAVAVGEMAGLVSSLKLDDTNSVLIRNDNLYRPTFPYVDVLIKQLVNVELTMRLNINAQKCPVWINTREENALRNKNAFLELYECEPVQFHDTMKTDEIEFFNSGIPYIGNELADTYNVYKYRIMAYLGIDNPGVDKKERLVVSESDSNADEIMMIRNARLEQRQIAVEKINEIFGLNVGVECNKDLTDGTHNGNMQGTQKSDMESAGVGEKGGQS